MHALTLTAAAALAALAAAHPTTLGCFATPDSFSTPTYEDSFISHGLCARECSGKPVTALSGIACYCADTFPADLQRVDDARCDIPCAGFPGETCGGEGVVTLVVDGHEIKIPDALKPKKEDGHGHGKNATTTVSSTTASGTATSTSSAVEETATEGAGEGEEGEENGDGESAAGRMAVGMGAVVAAVVAAML